MTKPRLLLPQLLLAGSIGLTLIIGCSSRSTTKPTTRATSTSTSAPTIQYTFLPDANPSRTVEQLATASKKEITYLADDKREGRGLGTKGLNQAANYISTRFKSVGLKPVEGLDNYFQKFELPFGREIDPATRLAMQDHTFELSKDFVPMSSSGSGEVKGEVVFVGYAINDDDVEYAIEAASTGPSTAPTTQGVKGYNDFNGVDVKGKVALAMRYEPHGKDGTSRFTGKEDDYSGNASIMAKTFAAREAGATALLLVNPPEFHEDQEPLQTFGPGGRGASLPVIHITESAANELLEAAGEPDLKTLQARIDESVIPNSIELKDVKLDGEIKLETKDVKVKNVVGVLPGVGPRANEYVIIGAHYDHVGKGEIGAMPTNRGQIHNGADDNASGTSAVMQLAEEFAKLGPQPRSIIFMAFTGEESGLLGSEYFVNNPPIPLENVVAMLNLDMVGRVKDEHLYIGGAGTAPIFDPLLALADEGSALKLSSIGRGGRGPSDHASFSEHDIPVLFLFSGNHPDYHKPGDDVEKINFEGVAQIVGFCFDLVRNFAAMEREQYVDAFDNQRVEVDVNSGDEPPAPSERSPSRRGPRVQLGIEPDYGTGGEESGVLLGGVTPKTAAADAGLQKGDRIMQLNETKIDSLETLFAWLGKQKVGDKVTITFVRNGGTKTAETTLKARGESN